MLSLSLLAAHHVLINFVKPRYVETIVDLSTGRTFEFEGVPHNKPP